MLKAKFENALHSLYPALRARLSAIIAHLHEASWPDHRVLCFADDTGAPTLTPPPEWSKPHPHEADQIRYDTYRWSLETLKHQCIRPVSLAEALGRIEDGAPDLIETSVKMIGAAVEGMVAVEYRCAVLSRHRLVEDWTWPMEPKCGGTFLHMLLALCDTLPPQEKLLAAWPPDAAITHVADWARHWLGRNVNNVHNVNVADVMKETRRATPMMFPIRPGLPYRQMASSALALLYLLEQEILQNQRRPFIAVDTCREHTKFLEGCRDLPKTKAAHAEWAWYKDNHFVMLLPEKDKKRHFQLSLDLGSEGLSERMTHLIREWRRWAGLRHWVTFQSLLTANKRLGWVRWTVEDHLKAQNLSPERRRRPKVRREAAEMVTLFTQIELAVYDHEGTMREQRPLILKGATFERLVDSQWEIEGLELQINPLLYRGVRDPRSDRLGKNWWPTSKELPHIEHDKYGPAIALGMILPGRWRMELAHAGNTFIDLRGDSLLRAMGLGYDQRNATAMWRSVSRNLAELQKRAGIESWEWKGLPSLSNTCRLSAPQWALDRIAHGVPSKELTGAQSVLTGSELKAWRKEQKLTQLEAAKRLGVGVATLRRAEAKPDKPLTSKLRSAFSLQSSALLT